MAIKIKELLRGATKHYQKRRTGADVPYFQPDQVVEFVPGGDITVVDGVNYTEGDFIVTSYASAAVCIQAAFDFIKTKGGTIYIRAGSYSINTTVSTLGQTKEVTIRGDGQDTQLTQAAAVPIITIASSYLTLRDLVFNGGDFLSHVVLGSFSTAAFTNIVVDRCKFFDPLVAITRSRFLLKFDAGTIVGGGSTNQAKVTNCRFEANNTYTAGPAGSLVFVGSASLIDIKNNRCGGQALRSILFDTDNSGTGYAGSHVNIVENQIDVSSSSMAKYGITVYGWREFTNISSNIIVMRAGGGFQCAGILRVLDPFAATAVAVKDIIADNIVYCSSTETRSRTIYVHGQSGANYLEGVSIVGNMCDMALPNPTYNVSIENCTRVIFEGNCLRGLGVTCSLDASTCSYSTIGVNHVAKEARAANQAVQGTSFNVQDQIAKGWAKVESNGALIGGYNVASTAHVGVGVYTVNWDRDMDNLTYYCPVACADANGGYDVNAVVDSTFNAVGSTRVITFVTDTPGVDDTRFYIVIFGQSVNA